MSLLSLILSHLVTVSAPYVYPLEVILPHISKNCPQLSKTTLTRENRNSLTSFILLSLVLRNIFSATISSDDYIPQIDKLMEQVKQSSCEIIFIKNDLNEDKKDIIYLKDDKVRHNHDIISFKIDVANCSERIKETTEDSTWSWGNVMLRAATCVIVFTSCITFFMNIPQ